MEIIVEDSAFETSTNTQTITLVAGITTQDVVVDEADIPTILVGAEHTIQVSEESWLLYDATVKTLTDLALAKLLDGKLPELNTGIYQYINQVSTLKEQAIAQAELLVANLQSTTSSSIGQLLDYNSVRATETSSLAETMTVVQAALALHGNGITGNAQAIDNTKAWVAYDPAIGAVSIAEKVTKLNSELNEPSTGTSLVASAVKELRAYTSLAGSGQGTTALLQDLNTLQRQNDGVVETFTGTQSVVSNGKPALVAPYDSWYNQDTSNGNTVLRSAHTGDTFIKYHLNTEGVKEYETSHRFVYFGVGNAAADTAGYGWALITDSVAVEAYTKALAAKDLADEKRRSFIATPVTPYDVGDIWFQDIDNSGTMEPGEIYRCKTAKASGDFSEADWVLASKYTDDSALDKFISVTYNNDLSTLKNQLDKSVSYTFGLAAAGNPMPMTPDNHGDIHYYTDTKVGYRYDSISSNWTQLTAAEAAVLGKMSLLGEALDGKITSYICFTYANQAEVADSLMAGTDYFLFNNPHGFYKRVTDINYVSTWTNMTSSMRDGDLLYAYNDNMKAYRWTSGQGMAIRDGLVTGHDEDITSLKVAINYQEINGVGTSKLINDLDAVVQGTDGLASKISTLKSKFEYTSSLKLDNNNEYITGFGLNSTISGTDGSYTTSSNFKVSADTFELIDPATSNKVRMDENGLYFLKSNNETWRYMKNVTALPGLTSGVRTATMTNVLREPTVLVSPATMPTYLASKSNQNQSFEFGVSATFYDPINKTFSFIPKANLVLTENVYIGDITGGATNTSSSTIYSSSEQITQLLGGITLYYNIHSTRGAGVANTYYYRQCVVTIEYSSNGSSWSQVGSSVTKEFGASLEAIQSSISYEGSISVGYVRLKFVYSDKGGTFTLGSTTWTHTLTINASNVSSGSCKLNSNGISATNCTDVWQANNVSAGAVYKAHKYGDSGSTYYHQAYTSYDGISTAIELKNSISPDSNSINTVLANTGQSLSSFAGYSVVGNFTVSNPQISGGCSSFFAGAYISMLNYCFIFDSFTSDTRDATWADTSFAAAAYSYADIYSNYCTTQLSLYLDWEVTISKTYTAAGSTTTSNTANSFTYSALATEDQILDIGTVNAIVVE